MHFVRSLVLLLCLGLINPGLSNAETEVKEPEPAASMSIQAATEFRCLLGTKSCLEEYTEIDVRAKGALLDGPFGRPIMADVGTIVLGLNHQLQVRAVIDLSWALVEMEDGYFRFRVGTDKGFDGALYRLPTIATVADVRGPDMRTPSMDAYDPGGGVDLRVGKLKLRGWVDEASASASVIVHGVGSLSGVMFHGEVGRRLVWLTGVALNESSLARPGEGFIRLMPDRIKLGQLGDNTEDILTLQLAAEGDRLLVEGGGFASTVTVASVVEANMGVVNVMLSTKLNIPLRDMPVAGHLTAHIQIGPFFGAFDLGPRKAFTLAIGASVKFDGRWK
ncbi:hypothetical protein [Ramlibacter humi]|uniref:Uncharacterized protein n=1 Tax=Ramlibacter humi TaxID=2530451 RepID=A0A4Z0BL64_9BURK|nr:hypothetical protein [Ramlibacter humi]TFZ00073.1 hypothetical protein EZ216_13260 [Ramlibacter humi]